MHELDQDLFGYLMGALDEAATRKIEDLLAHDLDARERLIVLKQSLTPLTWDGETPAPASDLVERTLARIAGKPSNGTTLPLAPPVHATSRGSHRSWWRRADVLIAACLLLTIGGIGLITLGRMRGPTLAMVECKNNLRLFHAALQQYREQHRQFPDVGKEAPRDVAGMVVPILKQAGTLPETASIRCAGIGAPMPCQQTVNDLSKLNAAEFDQVSPCLSMCYAYSLGHRDPAGGRHGPVEKGQSSLSQTPIMADRPPGEGVLINSVNHGGAGQNVLFADGHVRFLLERTFGSDDIFVNRAGLVAAGLDAADFVLGFSAARP